jgi:hypothetical protein
MCTLIFIFLFFISGFIFADIGLPFYSVTDQIVKHKYNETREQADWVAYLILNFSFKPKVLNIFLTKVSGLIIFKL